MSTHLGRFLLTLALPLSALACSGCSDAADESIDAASDDDSAAGDASTRDSNALVDVPADVMPVPDGHYRLEQASRTSAGVFRADGTLIRTLWTDEPMEAGDYEPPVWDGVGDDGQEREPGDYVFKLISSNTAYEWEGAHIGNTSDNRTGDHAYHGLMGFFKILVAGDSLYFSNNYNEQRQLIYRAPLSDVQVPRPLLGKGSVSRYIAADDENIYWSGRDGHTTSTFVYATRMADDTEAMFDAGVPLAVTYGMTYASALNVVDAPNAVISGLARSGDYLYVARQFLGTISVLDMSAGGALVATLEGLDLPRELTADDEGNLWVVTGASSVARHPVEGGGRLGSATLTLTGLEDPLALALTPGGETLAICDAGTRQQLRFFDASSGTEGAPFGERGGYRNGPEVRYDKFYFTDQKTRSTTPDIWEPQLNSAGITYQSDGSYWVIDVGNERAVHYSPSNEFIERIQYIPDWLILAVDRNDPTRLFVDAWEYAIDYSEPELERAWTLKNNWGYDITDRYRSAFGKMHEVVTLDNGRTYALIGSAEPSAIEIAELTTDGIRFSGVTFDLRGLAWHPNGDIVQVNSVNLGDDAVWTMNQFAGFDAAGNPQFSEPQVLARRDSVTGDEPVHRWGGRASIEFLGPNELLSFDTRPELDGMGTGYHLGLLNTETNEWIFQVAPATGADYSGDYPDDGRFDTGNGVVNAGGQAMAFGDNIVWNYYGEFWKGGFQTNKFHHHHRSGLLIDIFGVVWTDNPNGTNVGEASAAGIGEVFTPFAGMAGNAFRPRVVVHPDDDDIAYIYHADESWHGGVHRWRLTGLNSIVEHPVPITLP